MDGAERGCAGNPGGSQENMCSPPRDCVWVQMQACVVVVKGAGVCVFVCMEVGSGVLDLKFTPNHSGFLKDPISL